MHRFYSLAVLPFFLLLFLAACNVPPATDDAAAHSTVTAAPAAAPAPTADAAYLATVAARRSPDVPALPFADNPDPLLCGIPVPWNSSEPAWLNGVYDGELIEPQVHLYDSHLRLEVVTRVPHGTRVKILLFQSNPQLNYYLVKIEGAAAPNEGWVPEPFISFEPVAAAE